MSPVDSSEKAWHAIGTEAGEVWIDPVGEGSLARLSEIATRPATSYLVCGEGPCFGPQSQSLSEAVLIGCAAAFPQHQYVVVGDPRRLHGRLSKLTGLNVIEILEQVPGGIMLAALVCAAIGVDRLAERILPLKSLVLGAKIQDQSDASHKLPWLLDIPCSRHLVIIPSSAAHPIELSDLRPLDVPQNGDIDALTGSVYYVGSAFYRDSITAWKGRTGKVDWLVFEDTETLPHQADDLAFHAEMQGARVDHSYGTQI